MNNYYITYSCQQTQNPPEKQVFSVAYQAKEIQSSGQAFLDAEVLGPECLLD